MQSSYNIFLVLHFIGISGLLGGLLSQGTVKPKHLPTFALHSAWLAFVAALVMVGLNQMMHSKNASVELLDHVKIGIKSAVIALILLIGYLNIRKSSLSKEAWGLMTLLTTSNIVIAVFW